MTPTAIEYLRLQADRFAGRATIVGKGPSCAELDVQAARRERFVVGLNEVSLRVPCHAAFVIDEEILERHAAELAGRGLGALITPRVMHRLKSIGKLAIYGPVEQPGVEPAWPALFGGPVLRFNLGTAEPSAALGETVPGYHFSAPTLAHLLAMAGFTDIQLAGIDGGTHYSADFRAYEYKKLRSLQDSYDVQFNDLRMVRDRFGVNFRSVRCDQAHVLIGGEPEQCLATEVLKWSIESHSCLTVRYVDASSVARELYAAGKAGTPFSFQRIFLPQLAGHHGRGVYFDSDMLVMRDVYELFNWDMGASVLLGCLPTPGRDPQFSVFLVDNARATWDPEQVLDDYRQGRATYRQLIGEFSFAQPQASILPVEWNSLERFERGRTANVHFTDMGTQPWLSVYNPHADLWCEALFQAATARASVREALERSNAQGWVRPSLQWQIEHGHANPWTLPRTVKRRDRDWQPPHVRARLSAEPHRLQMLRWHLAGYVRRAMRSRAYHYLSLARIGVRKLF
jgi:hypothetical protein